MAVTKTKIEKRLRLLAQLGEVLDVKIQAKSGVIVDIRTLLMIAVLKITNREGNKVPFRPNAGGNPQLPRFQHNVLPAPCARDLPLCRNVAARFFIEVVDPQKFTEGLGKVIDGVVQCLNASVWAKKAGVSS